VACNTEKNLMDGRWRFAGKTRSPQLKSGESKTAAKNSSRKQQASKQCCRKRKRAAASVCRLYVAHYMYFSRRGDAIDICTQRY